MAMATVEEVEILISKLLSDKSKLREEGIKQLLSYLDATGGVSLAPLLDLQTTLYSQPDKLLSSTWPGVVRAVCQCNKAECTSSKKRVPKPIFSKALRSVMQKAEDRIHDGASLFSPQDLKSLFSHLLEVILDSPSFITDYSHIIRQLVTISDYCAQMSRHVYSRLVGFFMERIKVLVLENMSEAASCKEDAFRAASTLYCLLQNPPEDFLAKVREPLIEGFNDIFLHLRDEGRIARKLVASLNLFLLKDGVNLGDLLIDVHSSIKGFVLRTWKVTRDREFKDELVFYGRLQLKFRTVLLFSEGDFVIQMQPLVEKDLDQSCAINFATGSYRFDGGREGKLWTITKGVRHFLDFAASILMEAHKITGSRCLAPTKRQKKDDVFSTVTERLLKGNSLWWGTFCLLVRYHHQAISRLVLVEWLHTLSGYLERAFTDASSTTASFEALVWNLRCLQELAAVSPFVSTAKGEGKLPFHVKKQCESCWEFVWVTVLHWLPLFSSTSIVVEESFKLLGFLLIQSLLPVYAVPKDFWGFKPLSDPPSGNVLFFLASYFTSAAEQVTVREEFELWKKLLENLVSSADKQEHLQLKSMAILALTVGCFPQSIQLFSRQSSTSRTVYELQDWAKPEEDCKEEDIEFDALDELVPFAMHDEHHQMFQDLAAGEMKFVSLPVKHMFLKELADVVIKKAFSLIEGKRQSTLEQLFSFSAIIVSCFSKIGEHLQRRGKELQEWSPDGQVYRCLLGTLNHCIYKVEESIQDLPSISSKVEISNLQQSISEISSPETKKSLQELLSSACLRSLLEAEHCGDFSTVLSLIENLLRKIVRLMHSCNELLHTVLNSQDYSLESPPSLPHTANVSPEAVEISILDADFDNVKQSVAADLGGSKDAIDYRQRLSFKQQWRFSCLNIIIAFAQQLPETTCDVFLELLQAEDDPKVQRETLLCLCKCIRHSRSNKVPYLVDIIETQKESSRSMEATPYFVLTAANSLLTTLLSSEKNYTEYSLADLEGIRKQWNLPEKMFVKLARLLDDVSQNSFLFWRFRGYLVEAIAKLVVLDPAATDALLDRFLSYLRDVDYRVRCIMAKNVKVLFQAYTGHEGLFKDICTSFEKKMIMAANELIVNASEVSLASKDRCIAETAVMTLGEVAACSEKVEVEAVFMICANAAIFPPLRLLARTILDSLARQLHYPNRWKYLSHLLCCIFSYWVKVGLPIPTLVEVRDLLVCNSEPVDFLKYCTSLVLPPLLLYDRDNELTWLAKILSKPISTLVKDTSAAVFSSLLPLYCHGCEKDKVLARSVLQGKMLAIANLSEDDRDLLIRKNMVSIVNGLFQLCSVADSPQFPLHTKGAIISSIRTVVDGFCGSESYTSEMSKTSPGVKDVLKIFRADRVFMFILQIHLQLETSYSSRHQRNKLAGLECLIDVIQENVKVPNTCRYLFHTVLQSLEKAELHKECCNILNSILNILSTLPREEYSDVLGPQLQLIVLHLVSVCTRLSREQEEDCVTSSPVFSLLKQITINADPSLYLYIKELPPFPDLPVFGSMQAFLVNLQGDSSKAYDFSKFVMQTTELPSFLRLKSLQNLREVFSLTDDSGIHKNRWIQFESKSQAPFALLRLVRQCFTSNLNELVDVVGDIVAMMGIGDPHAVVFSVPGIDDGSEFSSLSTGCYSECPGMQMNSGVSDDVLKAILLELKAYLLDEHALVIELTVQTLKGVLSTEKGCRVLKNMQPKDSKYLSVFSRGPSEKMVEDLLNTMKVESMKKSIPLENDVLWDVSGKVYDDWVCSLVYSLMHYCEDTILRLCQGVVHCKSFLAQSLLPHVLKSLAVSSGVNSNICKLISCQVERHIFSERNQNTRSIQLFLDALNELRRCDVFSRMRLGQAHAKRQDKSKVYWLELDYLQTARVAQKCGAYFTSALYVEHWCEEKFGRLNLGEPDFSDEEELPLHMNLLLTIYTQINEPDGAYGVVRSHKLTSQIRLYEHEGNWSRAVGSYDLLLRNMDAMKCQKEVVNETGSMQRRLKDLSGHPNSEWNYNKGLMKSLQRTGCNHVLKMYCEGLALEKESLEQDIEFQELQFESAWRAGKWDFYYQSPKIENTFCNGLEIPKNVRFHSNLYWCLRSLHEGDRELFLCRMKCAKQELVRLISLTSLESTGNVFPTIIRLQILNSLCKAWDVRWQSKLKDCRRSLQGPFIPASAQLAIIDYDRQQELRHMQYQFDLFEPFVAYYTILLRVLQCESHVPQQLLDFATFARKAGRVNQASAAIHELKQHYKDCILSKTEQENVGMSVARKVQEAKILWAQDQQEMAVNLLKYVINHYNIESSLGSVYCLTGKWLANTRLDSARIILTQYLQKAVQLLENTENKHLIENVEKRSRAFYRMAHYSDSLYKSYEERLNSNEWQAALQLRTHKSKEAEVLARRIKAEKWDSTKKGSQGIAAARLQDARVDLARKLIELQKQLAMDNEEAQRLESDKETFMRIALNSYRQCLITSNKYDLRVVFRITSLWFNLSTNQGVVKSMLDTINQVKSYKFLPLVYQIASRLGPLKESQGVPSFQYALTCLLRKLATDHPYHTVNQLLALANGDRVKDKQKNRTAFVIDMEKKLAAEAVLNALASEKKSLFDQMRQLVEIYIKLAEIEVKKEDMNKRHPLPRDIRGIRQLELVPVITAEIPISPNAEYPEGHFPYYKGLSDRFLVMHGVNAPKVVECLGSDGRQYRQLAKSGDDDLRQDAVMEQLFSLVNLLLQHHPDTRQRRLCIRTYKVVPFTPSAGVLEWVNGTMPLGEYLLGSDRKGGAHARYGPDDWTFPTCREHLEKEEDKHSAFQNICQNFRPVFHNFFLEKFAQSAAWFERRLAYTRSVAASSMVGYIVGLGDRHAMNILLDQESAEVVHIDLGVAFEQGKMLKMPERVPFRLTRDIVDGMGVTGVEGVFRRCCEKTLLVMRANKDALLTIIEVFIHDPLYKWALSPLKALQRQQETIDLDEFKEDIAELESSGENKDAARALMRVKQKLDGYEGGDMRSVEGQVQQLIQDAQDSDKLCQMYPGWGAWL